MDEKTAPSKNNDCYFYYYSSCSKGDACPFRHEPAALRNETVCIFWLQGNCNKSNCIFRHMELTKQRDRIACWFESQPGGCKKPHCPFQHQNILDHPREEDIKKKPDLILPVRKDDASKDEAEAVSTEEVERQIVPSRNEFGSVTPPRQAYFSPIPRNPIIVPLQDGESDSESVTGSPYKRGNPELSAQLEWELRKLRQIQAHEADIIGYVFADDDEEEEERLVDENMVQNQEMEEYVVEEILEVEEEPDAAHRRLHPPPKNSLHGAQVKSYPDPVGNDFRKNVLKQQVSDSKIRRKVQISERLGGVASRALAETLGTNVQLRKASVKRLTNRKDEQININSKVINERLGQNSGKKLSITDRLGLRHGKESFRSADSSEEETSTVDTFIANRIMAIRNQHENDKVDPGPDPFETSDSTKTEEQLQLGFTVKSLADIRAEKQRKVTIVKKVQPSSILRKVKPSSEISKIQSGSGVKNGTKLLVNAPKEIEAPKKDRPLKILTLSEIKAKQQQPVTKNNTSSGRQKKRSISPISFSKGHKKISLSFDDDHSVQETSLGMEGVEPKVSSLGTRRISVNRPPGKKDSEPLSRITVNKPLARKELDPLSRITINKPLAKKDSDPLSKITINKPAKKESDPLSKITINKPAKIGSDPLSKITINKPSAKKESDPLSRITINKPSAKKESDPLSRITINKPSAKKESDPLSRITINKPSAKKDSDPLSKITINKPAKKESDPLSRITINKPAKKDSEPLSKKAINRSPAKKDTDSEPSLRIENTEKKMQRQEPVTGIVLTKVKEKSVDSSKNNNNVRLESDNSKTMVNVSGSQPSTLGVKSEVTNKSEKQNPPSISAKSISLSRNDSILDEEEALLLGADTLELEDDDDIDEAALLL